MIVTHELHIDLIKHGCHPVVAAVQGEANTRQLVISLFSNSIAWEIPTGATAAVAFRKPDGTRGLYDKLPDGSRATTLSGNTVSAILAPQVLTCVGIVLASIVFYDADLDILATFPFKITVVANPAAGEQISNNYYTLQNLDQVNAAYSDLLTRVENLENGNTGGGSGTEAPPAVNSTALTIIRNLLTKAVYTENVTALLTSLDSALAGGGTGGDNGEGGGTTTKTLVSISAAYSGGTVVVGDTLNRDDITVVAIYSDGSAEYVTDYTLSGAIDVGDNIIVVSYGGKTTTFTVTCVDMSDPIPPIEPEVFYVITNLTHVSINNSALEVNKGAIYLATITPESGYEFEIVRVEMGDKDITSSVYSNGVINIPSVTGDISILAVATAVATETVEEAMSAILFSHPTDNYKSYPDTTTFEYTVVEGTAAANYKGACLFEAPETTGGTLVLDFDHTRISGAFRFMVWLLNTDGTPYKILAPDSPPDYTGTGNTLLDGGWSGDMTYTMLDPGSNGVWAKAKGQVRVEIPNGKKPIVTCLFNASYTTMLDETLIDPANANRIYNVVQAVLDEDLVTAKIVKEV